MASELTGKKVAMIVSNEGIEESELTETRAALEKVGAEVYIIAPKEGVVQTMNHTDKSAAYEVDATLDEVETSEYDAVVLPGGAVNADLLRIEPLAQRFVQKFDELGKPLAAICHAPWLLISAGIVKGRRLTGFHTIADDVINAGGQWNDAPTVVDANLITSRKPDDIPSFNEAIIRLFSAQKRSVSASADHEPSS